MRTLLFDVAGRLPALLSILLTALFFTALIVGAVLMTNIIIAALVVALKGAGVAALTASPLLLMRVL